MDLVQEGFGSGLLPFSLPLIVSVFLKEGFLRPPLASDPYIAREGDLALLTLLPLPPKSWDGSWATIGLVQDGFLS